jgi:transposase
MAAMYYCGIDVAKWNHTATVIDEEGQVVVKPALVSNDQAGVNLLLGLLAPYQDELLVGLESTGHYWLALYDQLTQRGYAVVVINPLQVRAFCKLDIRKRKTDRVDAVRIAQFVRFARPPATDQQLPVLLQLRELTRFRFRLVQQIGDCKRKILSILDRVFPEFQTLFSNVFLQSARQLLEQAVTAEEFATFDLAELEAILAKASRGRFGREKALEVRRTASCSIGVSFLTDAIHMEMQCLLAQMRLLEHQVDCVQQAIAGVMADLPQYITTIPGVGLATGAAMLAEIGDVTRFSTLEKLVAYAGIDASVFKTGEFEGDRMHMSKRGSPHLRQALWLAAGASLLNNPELKAFYDKKRAEGKPHGVAMGAVCRKLLSRVYIILKEQRPYEMR